MLYPAGRRSCCALLCVFYNTSSVSAIGQRRAIHNAKLELQGFGLYDAISTASVRFYIYDDPGVAWIENCSKDRLLGAKYYPDFAMHLKLLDHPWRTEDPSEAQLYFVPAYLSASVEGYCGDHEANMQSTTSMLQRSEFFRRRGGKDHLISGFKFAVKPRSLLSLGPLAAGMLVAHYQKSDFPMAFPVPYGPVGAILPFDSKPHRARNHSLFFMGQADNRSAYKIRKVALTELASPFPDSVLVVVPGSPNLPAPEWLPACLDGDQRKLLRSNSCSMRTDIRYYIEFGRDSQYMLATRGDTPGSSRVYDALQFGAIPIMISDGFKKVAMPFPSDVDWNSFTIPVPEQAFLRDPVSVIQTALRSSGADARYFALAKARFALDWAVDGHCIATALLSHLGRSALGRTELPPALATEQCDVDVPSLLSATAAHDSVALEASLDDLFADDPATDEGV